ncbi:hypothetical protein JJP45_25560 [Bacillus cereus]|nr:MULTISPECIES: hypothetical protein [Bacillus cereus group]MBK4744338.1 hypothetical protein [Bacillus cereus]MCU4730331.1 hypothetical protein [Bacillus cereus]
MDTETVTPFVKGVEIMPDGSVARTGTNYSGKFQEAHDASKASIQSRISNLESGGVKGTGNKEETFTVPKWSNDGKYDKVRGYRGRDLTKYDEEYLVDPRLVVEMNFKGKTNSGTNAAGWERNAKKFFNTLLKSNPEFWSVENTALIKRGRVPIVDEQFIKHFPQYKEYIKDPMRHHHIGEGGQAVALPKTLHPGYGGIHNVEKEWGITGIDNEIATRLETFINNLRR